MILDNYAADER